MLVLGFEQIPLGWRNISDILLVTFFLYAIFRSVYDTRVMAALNGGFVLFIIYVLAKILGFVTLAWLLESFFDSIFLVLVIIFSADIKQALAGVNMSLFSRKKESLGAEIVDTLVHTTTMLAQKKIGAIIVLEGRIPLGDFMQKGVRLNACASSDLLQTIFFPNTALHDGAVIMNKKGKILAAGCVLPLSQEVERKHFGTRHRAALGISEVSDSITIVVSEERGEITIARDGHLSNPLSKERLERILKNVLI